MVPRTRIVAAVLTALVAAVLLTACGDDDASATAADLEGVPWVLESGAGFAAGGAAPTATFADGRVTGTTGCNRYSGTYTVEGGRLTIETGPQTLKACPPPADEVEQAYLAALGRVGGWRVEGDELVLLADGAPALRFHAASPAGSWAVTSLNTGDALTSPIPGTELTATFAEDGTLSGSAGCNQYNARYVASGDILEISPPASTRKFCETPEGVMDQEAAYLAALPKTARFQLGEHGLELLHADGTFVATYAPR
ncbi:MAG: META domain-containing protein [Thermoleophilia bacterium]